MAILITGASGQFGRAAAELLLKRVPPHELILTTRQPEKLADLAARGAQVRHADFDAPGSLVPAFAGATRMLLISTARVGTRVKQHANAIDAAKRAGVQQIAYTSFVNCREPANPAIVGWDHRDTELLVEKSGVAWTHLRDNQYSEAVAAVIAPMALASGKLLGSAGEGKVGFVSREDCVACAAAVLSTPGHDRRAYDITGPELLSFPQAAKLIAAVSGKPVEYIRVTDEQMFEFFDSQGVPRHASDDPAASAIPWSSDDMVSFERAIREGYLARLSDDVRRLIGRAPRSLHDVLVAHRDSWTA